MLTGECRCVTEKPIDIAKVNEPVKRSLSGSKSLQTLKPKLGDLGVDRGR